MHEHHEMWANCTTMNVLLSLTSGHLDMANSYGRTTATQGRRAQP
jgi:hypothetical protein